MKILFVCLGNICRSPTAEAVMRRLASERGLDGEIEIESAGTGGWHVGEPPDPRATAAGAERDYALEGEARQVSEADFVEFDLLVAMDQSNHADLREMAPPDAREKVRLLREFGPDESHLDVPDPYYGARDGFAEVLDIVERCCEGLLDEVQPHIDGDPSRSEVKRDY